MSSGNLALSTVGLVATVACIPFETVTWNQTKVGHRKPIENSIVWDVSKAWFGLVRAGFVANIACIPFETVMWNQTYCDGWFSKAWFGVVRVGSDLKL